MTKVSEPASQFNSENGPGVSYTADSEHDQLITDSDKGNSPSDDRDNPSTPSSRPVPGPPSSQQLEAVTAQPTFNFTFNFPPTSSTRPIGQNRDVKGGRCSVCTKALCPRRHECNGSVNRAWCRHGHPEKIRWSEAEVERRIAAAA